MHKKVRMVLFLVASILIVQVSGIYDFTRWFPAPTLGSVAYGDISINSTNVIGVNNLQFGFQLDFVNTINFAESSTLMQMARDCNFKLIRTFDYYIGYTSGINHPCTHWDEATKTGTFNWASADIFVNSVYAIGAEPIIALGMYDLNPRYLPSGMSINSITGLPYPDSWAKYCVYWVRHFPNVRYWDIVNEPFAYFGTTPDSTKLAYFMTLYNAAYVAMKAINPNISIAFDYDTPQSVLNYAISHNYPLDRIEYHKYDSATAVPSDPNYESDAKLFYDAENRYIISAKDAEVYYESAIGHEVPIIDSESNLNSAWDGGTDPRNNQIVGATWLSLVLRQEILNGVNYHIHFVLSGSRSYETSKTGYGFGMIDSETNHPYFPYCLYKILGPRLSVGDSIIESNCAYDDMRVLSWLHDSKVNILLIHKATNVRTIQILPSQNVQYFKLEDPANTNFINAQIQSGMVDSGNIVMNGYSLVLLQVAPESKTVDIYDALLLAKAFNSKPGDPNWNIASDLNKDNVVDVYDIILLAAKFGNTA